MASQREIADGGGPGDPSGPTLPIAPPDSSRLARELTGALPCASCGYELSGLSVLDVCPECGTPIRATILAKVDPYAEVLQPLIAPRLTAAGILVWSGAAFLAAMLTWALRAAEAYGTISGGRLGGTYRLGEAAAACIAVSAVGALVLVRPHRSVPAWHMLAAAGGVLATAYLAALYWRVHLVFDATHYRPYTLGVAPPAERSLLRLGEAAMLLIAILGLRPNARLLAARSLILRLGKADRQSMRAMAAAVGVGALGDVVHLVLPGFPEGAAGIAVTVGNFLIAVGAMLLTLALATVAMECLRIAPVLRRPALSFRQLTAPRETVSTGSPR